MTIFSSKNSNTILVTVQPERVANANALILFKYNTCYCSTEDIRDIVDSIYDSNTILVTVQRYSVYVPELRPGNSNTILVTVQPT